MIKIAIIGYGNIGKAVLHAANAASDIDVAAVVSSSAMLDGVPVVKSIDELPELDVAVLCAPSRKVPELAEKLLKKGICTVDSYDIHSSVWEVREQLGKAASASGSAAIISAGWDPGSDSVIRALFEAMVPKGITYTNFGPGMSMGHTVAVKAIDGVRDALSITIPTGTGIHRRMVYVELQSGADFNVVEKSIKNDAYFVHDETHVLEVSSVDALKDVGHGVDLNRKGVSGNAHNQLLSFNMRINNPALTGQILVSCARAVVKQPAGCYTMIEVPPINYLPGSKEDLVRRLV